MSSWLSQPPSTDTWEQYAGVLEQIWQQRNVDLLPQGLPRWILLDWLWSRSDLRDGGEGWVFVGCQDGHLTQFPPVTPITTYAPDWLDDPEFPNPGLLASTEPFLPLADALFPGDEVADSMKFAAYCRAGLGWDGPRYFFSLASRHVGVRSAQRLLSPGFVYVLPGTDFVRLPIPHDGFRREPSWVSGVAATPLLCVPVQPSDFPLPIHLHDAERVRILRESDPQGFPWWPTGERLKSWGK